MNPFGGVQNFMVRGRTLSTPIEVRAARNWVATYIVDAGAAQRLIEQTGLEVAEPRPGRAIAILGYVDYADTDLGTYNEFTVSLLVRLHDAGPASQRVKGTEVRKTRIGVYIHHLPVDESFSMEAGRQIWGYPKTMANFDVRHDGGRTSCTLSQSSEMALTFSVRNGGLPWPRQKMPPTYTFLDDTLRLTRWKADPSGIRGRILGGAKLTLGRGPIADDLRSLGLPKRPLLSSSVRVMRATFGAAEIVHPVAAPAAPG